MGIELEAQNHILGCARGRVYVGFLQWLILTVEWHRFFSSGLWKGARILIHAP